MKKLLLGGCLIFSAIFCANAQLPYAQNFEVSMTSTPAGWSLGSPTHHTQNPGWKFANAWPVNGNSLWQALTATHTYCAYVDDVDYDYTGGSWNNTTPAKNYDTLYTSTFSCAAAANVFISFDFNFNNYTGGGESGSVAVSTNGGATWTTVITLPTLTGDVSWYNGNVYDISAVAHNQATVMVAFCWNNAGAFSGGHCGWGMAVDNINVYLPNQFDLSCTKQNLNFLMQAGTAYTFTGSEYNWGSAGVTTMRMNYNVNGGAVQSQTIGSIAGFNSLTSTNWNLNAIPFTPPSPGNYKVKFWADQINGNADQANANDTLTYTFMAVAAIQVKTPLFEEFNQASCDPCAQATPNLDSVLYNNRNTCAAIRYHVNWPGTDYMDNETWGPFVNARVGYYGVNGVPDAKLDGSTDIYPGTMSSTDIQNEATLGSPFSISVSVATYNRFSNVYTLNATVKSQGTFAAGLSARVALTVDTITYTFNQSTESIPQFVFPQVAEDMLPTEVGTSLAAFTPNSTQNVNVTWTKNHPWGQNPKTLKYDSTYGGHFVIFVQDNSNGYVYQAAEIPITDALGVQNEVSKGEYMEVYPNPTSGAAYVSYNLSQSENVNIEVYNMLGERVNSVNQGKMDAGNHVYTIESKSLQNGVYFVRFSTDNGTTTKRLVIQ